MLEIHHYEGEPLIQPFHLPVHSLVVLVYHFCPAFSPSCPFLFWGVGEGGGGAHSPAYFPEHLSQLLRFPNLFAGMLNAQGKWLPQSSSVLNNVFKLCIVCSCASYVLSFDEGRSGVADVRLILHVCSTEHIKDFRPEWCISALIYSRDTPLWLETLSMYAASALWLLGVLWMNLSTAHRLSAHIVNDINQSTLQSLFIISQTLLLTHLYIRSRLASSQLPNYP